jgi:hypothetical protein
MFNINLELVEKLKETSSYDGEGSSLFFSKWECDAQEEQLRFKKYCLENYQPKHILETGTNKGEFCYLAKHFLPDCIITTFDLHEFSGKCVDVVNEYFGTKDVTFIQGNTSQTLSEFTPDSSVDFAHVDGGHDYHTAYSDLQNCDRLEVLYVLVDDYGHMPSVINAVDTFCEDYPYTLVDQDDMSKDGRGLVLLRRNQK